MESLIALVLAVWCSFMLASGELNWHSCPDGAEILTTHTGQPFIINFGFRALPFMSMYKKDGSVFRPDGRRTFATLGRISFTSVMESDEGIYMLIVGNSFNRTVCLAG